MLTTNQPAARGTRPATARPRRQLPFSRAAQAAAGRLARRKNVAAAAVLASVLLLGPSLMARNARRSIPAADAQRVMPDASCLAHARFASDMPGSWHRASELAHATAAVPAAHVSFKLASESCHRQSTLKVSVTAGTRTQRRSRWPGCGQDHTGPPWSNGQATERQQMPGTCTTLCKAALWRLPKVGAAAHGASATPEGIMPVGTQHGHSTGFTNTLVQES